MMNNKQHISYRLLSTVAVLSILIGSVVILHHDISFQRVFAQQATNPTVRQAPGQSSEDLVKSLMSPKSLMESVINQTRNTNATNFAPKQIVSKVNGTNGHRRWYKWDEWSRRWYKWDEWYRRWYKWDE